MNKKTEYLIWTDEAKPVGLPIIYNYSQTKNIELSVSKNGFYIKYYATTAKNSYEIINSDFFKDAFRKASIIYTLKYSAFYSPNNVVVSIAGSQSTIFNKSECDEPIIYSLCDGLKIEKISDNFNSEIVLNLIANTAKSNYDRRFAALNAYIISKSKKYEAEKFLYLWMAINSIYGYANEKKILANGKGDKGHQSENDKLKLFAQIYNWKYPEIAKRSENKLLIDAECLLSKMDKNIYPMFLDACKNCDTSNSFVQKIKELMHNVSQNDADVYSFMFLWLPYKIRCKFFHGENVIPLFSFHNESPIQLLKIINYVLLDYIEHHLCCWFDEKYLK